MEKIDLQALDARVEKLLHLCEQLAYENKLLRDQQVSLVSERMTLLEKNALARTRIEAMIERLKSMEIGT
jgi:cell division protein ZapB